MSEGLRWRELGFLNFIVFYILLCQARSKIFLPMKAEIKMRFMMILSFWENPRVSTWSCVLQRWFLKLSKTLTSQQKNDTFSHIFILELQATFRLEESIGGTCLEFLTKVRLILITYHNSKKWLQEEMQAEQYLEKKENHIQHTHRDMANFTVDIDKV